MPAGLRGSILGFAEDKTGALWIETADRVFRVRRAIVPTSARLLNTTPANTASPTV